MPDDALIIGAGAAGLAAAGVLKRAGFRSLILEGRERIGGRVHTIHPPSSAVPVELGAEFVHGRPAELMEHAERGRLTLIDIGGVRTRFEDGQLVRIEEGDDRMGKVLSRLREHSHPDRSFSQYLEEAASDATETEKRWSIAYIEGFNAARQEDISVQSLVLTEEASRRAGGEGLHRIAGGYDALIGQMFSECAGSELRLGAVLHTLRWRAGSVIAETDAGTFSASSAIITLPLAVLQAPEGHPAYVRFDPEPQVIRKAAARLRMGHVLRVTFEFRHRFWDWGVPTYRNRLDNLSMIYSLDPDFPTWWTSEPVRAPVITGWASGTGADRLLNNSSDEIRQRAAASLGRLFGVEPRRILDEIVEMHMHNWQTDRFAAGAYSYVPAGSLDAVRLLAEPVQDTLFFAGEATHADGRNGTVDGAIASGRRAAAQLLEQFVR